MVLLVITFSFYGIVPFANLRCTAVRQPRQMRRAVLLSNHMCVAQEAGIPPIMASSGPEQEVPLVDRQGCFVAKIINVSGQYVKDAYVPEEICQQLFIASHLVLHSFSRHLSP